MKKAFSLLELLIVIVVAAILYSSVSFSLTDTSLTQVTDKLVLHLNYARHLALKDNKMQYYPISNDIVEMNRSKYWFKQWWQLRLSKNDNGDYFYEIFSDSPYSKSNIFNRVGGPVSEYAKDPGTEYYMAGNYGNPPNKEFNLSYFHIVKVLYNGKEIKTNDSIRFVFDNYGNIYNTEGEKGDKEDINPYDIEKRVPILSISKLELCQDEDCKVKSTICISPKLGNAYLCN